MKNLAIYAIHPIMYQVPIFTELDNAIRSGNRGLTYKVLFGDDLSLRSVFYKETNTVFKPDTPFLLDGYRHAFLKNWSKDARSGFLSRINPGIVAEILRNRYDAILIHGYESLTAWLAYLTARAIGTKVLWRGESVLRGDETVFSWKKKAKAFVLKRFFAGCDAVLYSCTGNREYLSFYGVPQDKLFSIPCAVNNRFFQEERSKWLPQATFIRESLGIRASDFAVLFSARFTDRKRPFDLIEAAARVKREDLVLLFVGNGPRKDDMEQRCRELGVRAVFTGLVNQSEISKYYTVSDTMAVISSYDPSPKAMNEAMNFGLPIIVTDVVGTARDLVSDDGNGFVIRVGDVDALARCLDSLAGDRAKAMAMGRRSLERVETWDYRSDVEGIIEAFNYATGKGMQ